MDSIDRIKDLIRFSLDQSFQSARKAVDLWQSAKLHNKNVAHLFEKPEEEASFEEVITCLTPLVNQVYEMVDKRQIQRERRMQIHHMRDLLEMCLAQETDSVAIADLTNYCVTQLKTLLQTKPE